MTTILLVSAVLLAASYITARHSTGRARDVSTMLVTGFAGVTAASIAALLFGHGETWAFPLIFTFGVGLERRIIRQRAEAQHQQLVVTRQLAIHAIHLEAMLRSRQERS